MKIGIVGTGYVGLVTGTCLAEIGHKVYCIDIDPEKIANLKKGISPIYEPGLEDLILKNMEEGRLHFTTSIAEGLSAAKTMFIAVGTPEREDGSANLDYVLKVAEDIGKHCNKDIFVVTKSTVPVGTGKKIETLIKEILLSRGVSHKVWVSSNPEFLKEGAAVEDFLKPDRIVVGASSAEEKEMFEEMYGPLVLVDPAKLVFMDRISSELSKYAANSMLATRISFMNELSRLAEIVGADMDKIRIGMGFDPRIGKQFLYAGPGFGGSCFPKDLDALYNTSREHGSEMELIAAVRKVNITQRQYCLDKITQQLGEDLSGKTIALWGLSFKPKTDDVRHSPALFFCEELAKRGAKLRVHDPIATHAFLKSAVSFSNSLLGFDHAYDCVEGADALILVTEWPEYKRPDVEALARKMKGRDIFDFRNQWSFAAFKQQGFNYFCVGRPDSGKR